MVDLAEEMVEGRFGRPATDLRVRLANALERWAPGGIECRSLEELDQLMEDLLVSGVFAKPLGDGEVSLLAQKGDHVLFYSSGVNFGYRCSCGQWAAQPNGEATLTGRDWREHAAAS